MKLKSASRQSFSGLVDHLVLNAISDGIIQFDELIVRLPGIYPTIVFNSLKRLVSKGSVPGGVLINASRQVTQICNRQDDSDHRLSLPIPHPLDYDWRFSNPTAQYLLDKCLQLTTPGAIVVLLGTPSILRTAVEQKWARQWVLVDANMAMTMHLSKSAPQARIIQCDVRHDPLANILAALVVADPPWYEEHIRSFLWAASQLCVTGGHLLVSLPQEGTRPGIAQEWSRTLGYSKQLGFTFIRLEEASLSYLTPLFEHNALKAEGLSTVPKEWRRGNLAVFLRTCQPKVPRPLPGYEGEWMEEGVFNTRVRIRRQDNRGFQDPSLIPLTPGDVLRSVSRRDQLRKLADVWTSGNRIFACKGRNVLQQIIRAVATSLSPDEAVAAYVGHSLLTGEISLVSRCAREVIKIASLESREDLCHGEG